MNWRANSKKSCSANGAYLNPFEHNHLASGRNTKENLKDFDKGLIVTGTLSSIRTIGALGPSDTLLFTGEDMFSISQFVKRWLRNKFFTCKSCCAEGKML